MRINVYREELTDRIEIISKIVDGIEYKGLRVYLYMPVTLHGETTTGQMRGPFMHRDGDDDSSAITFWGSSQELCKIVDDMCKALHHGGGAHVRGGV